MDQLSIQTWVALIIYFSMAVSALFYGPKSQRTMTFIFYVLLGIFVAYITEKLAKNNYAITSWIVALMPLIISMVVGILALGTAMGIMIVKEAPKGAMPVY